MADYYTIKAWRGNLESTWKAVDYELEHAALKVRSYDTCALHEVHNNSGPKMRKILYEIALQFKREHGYDFTQYQSIDEQGPDQCVGWLFSKHDYPDVTFGGCCFRWRKWSDAPDCWALQFIWLHPYMRSHGYLRAAWPTFKRRFAPFYLEGPFSNAMMRFMQKQGIDYKNPLVEGDSLGSTAHRSENDQNVGEHPDSHE